MTEKIKLALALLLVAAGLGAFYALAEHAVVLRVLALLVGVGAAFLLMLTTSIGKTAFAFAKESIAEARKVVWPTRKETIQTTVAVFALVFVLGVIIWIVDFSLLWVVRLLMGRSE